MRTFSTSNSAFDKNIILLDLKIMFVCKQTNREKGGY